MGKINLKKMTYCALFRWRILAQIAVNELKNFGEIFPRAQTMT